MTFEQWLEKQLDVARDNANETGKIAPNSWGAGYDRGYADAMQSIFSQLTAEVAKSNAPEEGRR